MTGLLRVDGVMQGRCRMFDTPGVPHTHQLSSLLSADEVLIYSTNPPSSPPLFCCLLTIPLQDVPDAYIAHSTLFIVILVSEGNVKEP